MNAELIMLNSEIPGIHSDRTPFYNRRLADSYAHFFHLANHDGRRMLFASAEDFLPDGSVRGHWVPRDGRWEPVQEPAGMDMLFDKLGGNDPLFMSVIDRVIELGIPVFGHYGLNRFTGDKWACYEAFPAEHALTRLIGGRRETVEEEFDAFFDLMDHTYARHDNVAVIKPRWGWESRGLYLLERTPRGIRIETLSGMSVADGRWIEHILDELATTPYIIQAYVNTGRGIPELGLSTARHDARFIFSITGPDAARFVQAYVKTPDGMFYHPVEAFPPKAIRLLEAVADQVAHRFPYGIFSVDIMRDISGDWYVTELNDQIGFNIDFESPRDIEGVSQLMLHYLAEIDQMRGNRGAARYRRAL